MKFVNSMYKRVTASCAWADVPDIKGCVRYIFASLFFMSKREHFQNKEK